MGTTGAAAAVGSAAAPKIPGNAGAGMPPNGPATGAGVPPNGTVGGPNAPADCAYGRKRAMSALKACKLLSMLAS